MYAAVYEGGLLDAHNHRCREIHEYSAAAAHITVKESGVDTNGSMVCEVAVPHKQRTLFTNVDRRTAICYA
jgi:hypothetical protein